MPCVTLPLYACTTPTEVRVTGVDTDVVAVSWGPPAATDAPIQGYSLYWDKPATAASSGTFNEVGDARVVLG